MTTPAILFATTGSRAERLDARAKIIASTALLIAVVVGAGLAIKALVVGILIVVWTGARLGMRSFAALLISLTIFFVGTMLSNAVIRARTAPDLVMWGPIHVSPSGAVAGVEMCLQILGIVLALVVLVRTTAPTALSEGLEQLLAPAKRVHVPVHEAAMMFTIALRFLPVMWQEFTRLQLSQLARGGGVHRGRVWSRLRAIPPLLIPLFVVSLIRANELAQAMESRGYRGDIERTRIRTTKFGLAETVTVTIAVILLVVATMTSVLRLQ